MKVPGHGDGVLRVRKRDRGTFRFTLHSERPAPVLRRMVAADPFIAIEKMKRVRPDLILLDLEMPRMDGLTFIQKIMARQPLPVIVCSGLTEKRMELAISALELA